MNLFLIFILVSTSSLLIDLDDKNPSTIIVTKHEEYPHNNEIIDKLETYWPLIMLCIILLFLTARCIDKVYLTNDFTIYTLILFGVILLICISYIIYYFIYLFIHKRVYTDYFI